MCPNPTEEYEKKCPETEQNQKRDLTPEERQQIDELIMMLPFGYTYMKEKISAEAFELASEEIRKATFEEIKNLLLNGRINDALNIQKVFPLPKEMLKQAVFETIKNSFSCDGVDNASEIQKVFPLPKEILEPIVFEEIKNALSEGRNDAALKIQKILPLPDKTLERVAFEGMSECFARGCIWKASEIQKTYSLKKNLLSNEESSKALFDQVAQKEAWSDELFVRVPFLAGTKEFGYKKMFEYLSRDGLTLREGLHNFLGILYLADMSKLSRKRFYAQILKQVANDNAKYPEGNAQQKLNVVVNNFRFDVDSVFASAQTYRDIKKLKALVKVFQDKPSVIFSSWKYLKKYEELCLLLEQTELLNSILNKKADENEKMAQYIETLVFHPNVPLAEVLRFRNDPKNFLETEDEETATEIHKEKKPSNYCRIVYLNLSEEQLRDALIFGAYDAIQSFPSFEAMYHVAKECNAGSYLSLKDLIKKALGKRDEKIQGEAVVPKALFGKLNSLFKEKNISLKEYLTSRETEKNFPSDEQFAKDVRTLIFDSNIGIPVKTEEYRMKISKKSDPEAVVAGNDVSSCMPFGRGKSNVYMWNPACGMLLVQRKNAEGVWRTVAESLMTRDKDMKTIVDFYSGFQIDTTAWNETIKQNMLADTPSILTFDDVSVSEGFLENGIILDALYRDFSRRYISKFKKGTFEEHRAIIGYGYAKTMTHLPTIPNTFFSETPIGYSDNLKNESYELDLSKRFGSENVIIDCEEKEFVDNSSKKEISEHFPKGVSPLTFRDSLPTACLEKIAYESNENFIQNLSGLENMLIAKDVYNSIHSLKNMSFRYIGTDNKMHAYLIAWESESRSAPFIFLFEIASDGNIKAGGSLIKAFAESYKRNYADTGNLIPLLAHFREQTSYKIIMKQAEKLSKEIGVSFILEERGINLVGNDAMHELFMYPESLKEKERYDVLRDDA